MFIYIFCQVYLNFLPCLSIKVNLVLFLRSFCQAGRVYYFPQILDECKDFQYTPKERVSNGDIFFDLLMISVIAKVSLSSRRQRKRHPNVNRYQIEQETEYCFFNFSERTQEVELCTSSTPFTTLHQSLHMLK